jgi:hypothetical protein
MMASAPGRTNNVPRDQPAFGAMQEPADIDCELLCFRAWKQHAEVERMEETLLPDPLFFVDQDAVHHRDLPGRAAKAQRRDAGKCAKEILIGR